MLETYRGIPHLMDIWLVLTGTALPVALSTIRRPGRWLPRLSRFLLPASIALILAATLSPTAHQLVGVGQCGTQLTTTGGLTSIQGFLNVLLFVPAAALITITGGRLSDGFAAGIGLSAAIEAVQALIPQLGRSCQWHDLITNTLGVCIGVGLAAGIRAAGRTRPLIVVPPELADPVGALLVTHHPPARRRRGPGQFGPCRLQPVPIQNPALRQPAQFS